MEKIEDSDKARMEFILSAIKQHKATDLYKTAVTADLYDKKQNVTIMQYQKTLVTVTGRVVKDEYAPNHKVVSNFFDRFIVQQNQFLLGNGVTWKDKEKTKKKLGKKFDNRLQEAGKYALIGGVSFGFWNLDHLEVFKVTEFVPLLDEENGSLRAGVRWWQIDENKPLRATLYEEDGYTEYIWKKDKDGNQEENGEVLKEKKPYIINTVTTAIDGTQVRDGENYPTFPIVPFWGNPQHQSELVGLQEGIDAYDLIKNGYENDLDEAQLYWIVKGAGGMDDVDLAKFLQRLKRNKIVNPEDGQEVVPATIELPYEARERLLDRIEKDLYRDYQALNIEEIKSGSVVNAQIDAAYEPMNSKADQYEYCVLEFIEGILALAGIEDEEATFTRSKLTNVQENINVLLLSGEYLTADYITTKILTFLGDGDKAKEILDQLAADELKRGNVTVEEEGQGGEVVEEVVE